MPGRLRLLSVLWIPLAVALLAFAILAIQPSTANAESIKVDSAVVFLADVSGSMDKAELKLLRDSHANAIASREVIDAILDGVHQRSAFVYVEFAGSATTVVDWSLIDSPLAAHLFAAAIRNDAQDRPAPVGSMTGVGVALAYASDLLEHCPWPSMFRTVDVVGDGKSSIGIDVSIPRQVLLDAGVTINGLPMTLENNTDDIHGFYVNEVMGGSRSFVIDLRDAAEMPTLIRKKLLLELY